MIILIISIIFNLIYKECEKNSENDRRKKKFIASCLPNAYSDFTVVTETIITTLSGTMFT